MKIKLDTMSRDELIDLREQVDYALDDLRERERIAALHAAEEAANAHGYSLADLGVAGPGKARRKGKAPAGSKNPAKYRNPENPDQTWSGKGRRPQWIKDAEAAGTPMDTLLIS